MRSLIISGLALLYASLSFGQTNRVQAEVFVEITARGNYTVYLDNESIGSSKGRFRFYDVYNSEPMLSVKQGNTELYKRKLRIDEGKRFIFTYNRSGLNLVKELNIFRNRVYALNDWDDYVGAYNTGIVPPGRPIRNVLNDHSYGTLLQQVKANSFDDDRIRLIMAAYRDVLSSTQQLKPLLSEVRFEDRRLSLAKDLYINCIDQENYFLLADAFTFQSNRDALLDFIYSTGSKTGRPPRIVLEQQGYTALFDRVKGAGFDDSRIELINAATRDRLITTAQLKPLLKEVRFEDKRLELAKNIYAKCADRENYFTLVEFFTFKSNKDALLDFIGRR